MIPKAVFMFSVLLISIASMGQVKGGKEALIHDTGIVSKRLLSVMGPVPRDLKWPPIFDVIESEQINAYAGITDHQPKVILQTAILEVTDNQPDRLAYVIAHELMHIVKGHCHDAGYTQTGFPEYSFTAVDEEAADMDGLKLTLMAGYSYAETINTLKIMRSKAGDYSPLEAQAIGHPSWTQRLENLDRAQANLWRSMSAFQTGVTLMMVQNYDAAVACFEKVVKEFPACYEAWSNLGYASLMEYCDLFDLDDLAYFNIGQLVVGGFYQRPASLERAVRGSSQELWAKAIWYFQKALSVKSDLALVKSYLGIAFFLDPGKQSLAKSDSYFADALRLVRKDETLDPSLRACVYLNASAIDIAGGNFATAGAKIDSARSLRNHIGKRMFASALNGNGSSDIRYAAQLDNALDFNRVLSDYRRTGMLNNDQSRILLRYLRNTDPGSIWWKQAYRVYEEASSKQGRQVLSREQILAEIAPVNSPVRSVIVDGFPIYLSQGTDEILKRFANYEKVPVAEGRGIYRYVFPNGHFEILGGKEVLGISIKAPDKSISLGTSARGLKDIRPGIPFKTVMARFGQMHLSYFSMPDRPLKYYFFSDIGLAFGVTGTTVTEIMIEQKPSDNE